MLKFLSLFKRTNDEQLNDNHYDFNEFPAPENDIKGVVENQMPAFSGIASEKRQEISDASSKIDADIQEVSDKEGIERVRETLRAISDNPQSPSGENQVGPDRQKGESFFDINGKTLLGKGGENFVYAIPDDESIVGRVAIEPLIEQLAQTEKPQDTNATNPREALQAKVATENATYDELCTYFGNEHVPQTTRSVREVSTSREFLETIHKAKGRNMLDVALADTDMLTIVAIQEKVPEINDDKSLDVRGGLAEARNPKVMNTEKYRQAYEDATQALVCDPENASFDLDQFLIIHPDLRKTVEQADTNPQLKDALKDFVQKSMQYSKETGKSLDLNGAKNILFFEDTDDNTDNAWRYKLIDATSPYAEVALRKTKELMEKVVSKEPIEDHIDRHLLRCAVNYQRTLNGLAKQLGIEDHLDLIPHASTITPSEFWDMLYDGGPPESSSQKQEDEETPSQQSA